MHARRVVGTVVVIVGSMHASAVRADCIGYPPVVSVPFAGLSIPANAELRVINSRFFELTLPDGTTRRADPVDDATGQVLDIDVGSLTPGAYTFVSDASVPEGGFELLDEHDDEAPAPPVVTLDITSRFVGPSLPYAECPEDMGTTTIATFNIDGVEPGDVIVIDGRAVSADVGVTRGITDETAFAVSLRDLAGNESDATIVPVEGGCGGCTAATMSPLTITLFALLHRRRHPH